MVVNQATGTPKDAGGSTSEFSIIRISTTSDLESTLNINADASAGIAAFAGGSARFSFAQQMKVQSSSLFMAVTARVQLASESIDVPVLADQPPGAGATKLQNVANQYKSELFVHQYSEGGTILQINNQNDPMQLLQSVSAFLKSFQDNPNAVAVPFNCSLAPVAIAAGPLPPNDADREHARDVIVECARRRSATMDLLNLVQFISDHNSEYDFSSCSMDAITKAIVGLQSDLDIIARCASNAIDHTTADAPMPPQFAAALTPPVPYPTALPNPLPVRKHTPPTGPDLSRFVGTWNNTNPQGHISYITFAQLDANSLSAKGHLLHPLFPRVQPQFPPGGKDFTGDASFDSDKNLSGRVSIPGITGPVIIAGVVGRVSLNAFYALLPTAGDPGTVNIQYTEMRDGGEIPGGQRILRGVDTFKMAG